MNGQSSVSLADDRPATIIIRVSITRMVSLIYNMILDSIRTVGVFYLYDF